MMLKILSPVVGAGLLFLATAANAGQPTQLSDNQMDGVTQQNAALVEEAAAASKSLSDQAAKLVGIVSVFRLSGDPAAGLAL